MTRALFTLLCVFCLLTTGVAFADDATATRDSPDVEVQAESNACVAFEEVLVAEGEEPAVRLFVDSEEAEGDAGRDSCYTVGTSCESCPNGVKYCTTKRCYHSACGWYTTKSCGSCGSFC